MNQEIDYNRLSNIKNRCLFFAVVCVLGGFLYLGFAYSPFRFWVANLIFGERNMLTVVSLIAEQQQNIGVHATAVRVDSSQALKCDAPHILASRSSSKYPKPSILFNPVPTLTEFVISEEKAVVCIMTYEMRNHDSPSNTHEALANIRKDSFIASFGTIRNEEVMFRLDLVKHELDQSELNNLRTHKSFPKLYKMYTGFQRPFPVNSKQGTNFILNRDKNFGKLIENVRADLDKPANKVGWVLKLIGLLGFIAAVFLYNVIREIYNRYCEDMWRQNLPAARFRYFLAAKDVAKLTEEMISYRREKLRSSYEKRMDKRREQRKEREEAELQRSLSVNAEETPEQRDERRRRKIEVWCNNLRSLTPTDPSSEIVKTEEICEEVMRIVGHDFDGARSKISTAIAERKRLNAEEEKKRLDAQQNAVSNI